MKDVARILMVLALLSLGAKTVYAEIEEDIAYITICFDDAHSTIFTNARPVLQQYDIRATVYVPTLGIDDEAFWHMSWKQIIALQELGWEIGSHSHTHQSMTLLSPEKVEEELRVSRDVLAKHGIEAKTFATPLGDKNDEVVEAIKKYYVAHRGTERQPKTHLHFSFNDLDVDPYEIAGIELWHNYSIDKIKSLVERAIDKEAWVVFYLHEISNGKTDEMRYKFDVDKLGTVMAYLSELQTERRIKIVTTSEFIELRKEN